MAKYRVTFEPLGKTVDVDPADFPYGDHGLGGMGGSLLDIALANDVPIKHACGGVGACATCHVIVKAGAENLSPPSEEELDRVELASGYTPDSRLACLAVVQGDVAVTIPAW